MSNREREDAELMILRALMGEENVIEHMEAEGQQEAVSNTLMAKKMSPSREDFELLGFSFEDIPGDDVLCKATLPEGWNLRPTDHSMWSDIVDNNGMVRGSMFYKAAFYDRSANMSLNRRYGVKIDYEYDDEDNLTIETIYFGNEDEKLFVAGQISFEKSESSEERLKKYDKQDKLMAVAKEYGNQYYPDWTNVHAYWDDGKKVSKEVNK